MRKAGDVLNYTVVLKNTGNITLTGITISDDHADLSAVTPTESIETNGEMESGETWTYTYSYTVTQADLDKGSVLNKVKAGSEQTDPVDETHTTPALRTPGMALKKSALQDSFSELGEQLDYTLVITNTGNVTLPKLEVNDSLVPFSAMALSGDLNGDGNLDVGETWTLTYSYKVTREDLERGKVLNTAGARSPEYPDTTGEDEHEVPYKEPAPPTTPTPTPALTPGPTATPSPEPDALPTPEIPPLTQGARLTNNLAECFE